MFNITRHLEMKIKTTQVTTIQPLERLIFLNNDNGKCSQGEEILGSSYIVDGIVKW